MLCGLMLAFSIAAMPPPVEKPASLSMSIRIVRPYSFMAIMPYRISGPDSAGLMLNDAFDDVSRNINEQMISFNDFEFNSILFIENDRQAFTQVIFNGILLKSREANKILRCDRDAVTVNLANAVRKLQELYANSEEFLVSGKIVMTRDEIRFEKEGDINSVEEISEQPAPNPPASGAP